jgi:oligopeptide transport system substrate-binding protein
LRQPPRPPNRRRRGHCRPGPPQPLARRRPGGRGRWPRPPRAARLPTATVALALVLAAGCTGGGSGERPRPAPATTPGVGGTLAIALLDPGSLDPARAAGLEDQVVVGNLFDGLTTLDAAGTVRPAVAASWTSDAALRRWEFRLRPEARWADGTPVQAEDFTFAWERLADPRLEPRPSPSASLLAPVAGYREVAAGKARSIRGLQAPNPTTLVVELERPLAELPALVASAALSPLPRALVTRDQAGYLAAPVGNGPFRLAGRYRRGRTLTLERNRGYGGPPARLDEVSVHLVPDEQTAWLELQHGRVAFAPVPLDQVAAARAVHGDSADGHSRPGLLQGPTLATWELGFGLRAGPASDPSWRQAFSLAVDRQGIADALAGAAAPATGLVPPGLPSAVGGGAAPAGPAACAACVHDPVRAKALFAKVKGGRGPVALRVPAGGIDARIAALIADDLAAAGVKLQVTVNDDPQAAPVAGGGRVAAYPAMDAVLQRFSSRAATAGGPGATGGSGGPTGFADPAVDRLLDQAAATADGPARAGLYRQAEAAVLAGLPVAPILDLRHAAVLAPGVEGFDLTPWGAVDLAAVTLPG